MIFSEVVEDLSNIIHDNIPGLVSIILIFLKSINIYLKQSNILDAVYRAIRIVSRSWGILIGNQDQ
jgi:hypothetical protein